MSMDVTFRRAMASAGIVTSDPIIADGRLHRFHVRGDRPGSKNGYYILHDEGVPFGIYGSWKSVAKGTWCAKSYRDLSASERIEHERRVEDSKKKKESVKQKIRKKAVRKSAYIWNTSDRTAHNHAYLALKRVQSHGLRIYKDCLVIPMRDVDGNLHSLQFIDNEGDKRFLTGGRKHGLYFPIGKPVGPICIAEGYATAASIYEATGHATACAFDAGNLLPVAQILRGKFPAAQIIICADNDLNTLGNPGLTYARAAAIAINARLAIPPCAGDFNDFLVGGL